MADLISRAAAIDAVLSEERYCERNMDDETTAAVRMARFKLEKVPTADAAPVVHGRWIDENPDDSLDPRMRCSICTGVESPLLKWRYCPNCGAKMDGERRDSE